ncbi:hypothetical protein ACROYT_G043180 [Oculina patagonica]
MEYQGFLCALLIFGIGTLVGIASSMKDYTHERIFKDGDIILGGIFPLHLVIHNESCSDLRSNMLILSEAMIYAADEITKDGKILQNISLGYDIRDTCGNEQEGVSIASDFVYEKALKYDPRFAVTNSCKAELTTSTRKPVIAVIGGLDSRVSVNVANVLQVQDVPQISYGASSAELATSEFTSFFRTVPVDTFQSQAMAEFIAHYQWTCVAVIGVDDWYGRSGVEAFVTAANETGICIVTQELFPVHDSEDQIERLVTRLKSMKQVQIIILYSLVPQAVKVFEEAVKQDFTGRTWIASDGWSDSSLIQQPRFKPIIQGAIGFGFHAFRFGEFEKHVTEMTPFTQKGSWWNEFWEKYFNCTAGTYRSIPNQCFWECVPCDLDTVSERPGSTECITCPEGFISNQGNTKCEEVPIKFIEWGEPWGVALTALTMFCVLFTLVVLVIVIQKRKMPIIQDTGGFLNILFLIVALLSYIFNLILLSKPSDLACRVLPPVFYLIYTGAALVQFLKVYRIRALVKPATSPTTYSKELVYIIVAALWAFPFLVSFIWVFIDPPESEKYFVSRLVIYGVCNPYQTNVGLAMRYFCATFLSLIILTSTVVAYKTKGLPHGQRFDEAKHLTFSLTVFAVTFATFYPGWALIKGPSLTIFACKTNIVAATDELDWNPKV